MKKAQKNWFFILSLLILFIIPFTSASGTGEWNSYGGGDITTNPNAKSIDNFARLDLYMHSLGTDNASDYTLTSGYGTLGDQALTGLIDGNMFLFIYNTPYLKVYNSANVLQDQISLTGGINQLALLSSSTSGQKDRIAIIQNINASLNNVLIYQYNVSTSLFRFVTEINESVTGNIIGLTGVTNKVYGLKILPNNATSFSANISKYTLNGDVLTESENSIGNINSAFAFTSTQHYREPLSFIDADGDGNNEILYNDGERILLFRENGVVLFNIPASTSFAIKSAKFFKSDDTKYYRVAVYQQDSTTQNKLTAYNIDGSTLWTDSFTSLTCSVGCSGSIAVSNTYDTDNDNEIYSVINSYQTAVGGRIEYRVIKGGTGATLIQNISPTFAGAPTSSNPTVLTIADVNGDAKQDFIATFGFGTGSTLGVFDITNQNYIYPSFSYAGLMPLTLNKFQETQCIPTDVNNDGFLEIICSTKDATRIFYGNSTNTAPFINSLTFSPSLSVIVGNPLNILVSATDNESNSIVYAVDCYGTNNFTESSSSTQTCTYASSGFYNLTIGVRDNYHVSYNTLSQIITVTLTGLSCNNNLVCESGESNSNCPSDCPLNTSSSYSQSSNGGMPIPTELVASDGQTGLLPEIYYGIIAFLSNTLLPLMIIVFLIIGVLIIFAFGKVIKKLFMKVGN